MLPTDISRNVLGDRTHSDSPASQSAQLIGRSRNERLLDRIYNRQSRSIREIEKKRRHRAALVARSRSILRASFSKKEEILKHEQHVKPEDSREDMLSPSSSMPQLQPSSEKKNIDPFTIINSLMKFLSSPVKFPKVIKLALQLTHANSYVEQYPLDFLDLLTVLVYNLLHSSTSILPEPSLRSDIIRLTEVICEKLLSSFPRVLSESGMQSDESLTLSDYNEICLNDPNDFMAQLEEPVGLQQWLDILCILPLWHHMLLTDDTYQFHHALTRIHKLTRTLPPIVNEDEENITKYLPVHIVQRRHQQKKHLSTNDPPQDHQASMQSSTLSIINGSVLTNINKNNKTTQENDSKNLKEEHIFDGSNDKTSSFTSKFNDQGDSEENSSFARLLLTLPKKKIAYEIQRESISKLLATLYSYAKMRWARAAVAQYFQYVYLNRSKLFRPDDRLRIEQYQASILNDAFRSEALTTRQPVAAGEAVVPIQDSRDEKIVAVHGAAVWSAKQTGL